MGATLLLLRCCFLHSQGGMGLPFGNSGASPLPFWSVAANMVLAVVVVVQSGLLETGSADSDATVLRGGEATVLLVANPEARLSELSAGLSAAKVKFVVRRKPAGVVHLIVQKDPAAFDYPDAQRIEPKWAEGIGDIELRKPCAHTTQPSAPNNGVFHCWFKTGSLMTGPNNSMDTAAWSGIFRVNASAGWSAR